MTRVYVGMVADGLDGSYVEFLRQARALGDTLVVGIPSDDDSEWSSVRPVVPLEQRARMVAECGHVDWVVAGAPMFATEAWLRDRGIDLVACGADISERDRRYWHRVPIELGMLRVVPCVQGHRRGADTAELDRAGPNAASPSLGTRVRRGLRDWLPAIERAVQQRALVGGLRRLADTLRSTPLDGHYWVVGGLLLGWAREGKPLASDLDDADFAYEDADHDRFLASVPALVAAGFLPRHRFSSAAGRYVEHRFVRNSVRFEFFRMTRLGDRWRFSMFVLGDEPTELVCEVPAQSHEPFRFLGREWRKVVDHDLALRSVYGEWRTDRPDWSYTSDRAIVERIPIPHLPHHWRWPHAIVRGPGERPPTIVELATSAPVAGPGLG